MMIVQLFQVLDQIVYSLRVQELAYNLRRLGVINGLQVLLHGCVVILLRVQVVAKLPKDDVLLRSI